MKKDQDIHQKLAAMSPENLATLRQFLACTGIDSSNGLDCNREVATRMAIRKSLLGTDPRK